MTNCHSLHAIENVKPGDHLCCIYETDEEHRQILTPFLRKGLQQGEKVLTIVDAHSAETVLGYLQDDGVDAAPYLASGQLVIISSDEAYLRDGVFDPDGMITLLQTEMEQSLAEGYSALRVTGEMTWALQSLPRPERLIEYEAKLNNFFPSSRCLAICQYDRRRFDPALLLGVLRTHPVAVIGTATYDNCYYVPPADLLGADPASEELARCLQHLAERRRMEETLRESEATARALLNAHTDFAAVLDASGTILDVNEAMARRLGRPLDELVGMNIWELFPPDVAERRKAYTDKVFLSGKPVRFEDERQGTWFDNVCYPVLDAQGEVTKIAVHARDITERVQAEMALREAKELFETTFATQRDAILLLNAKDPPEIMDCNPASEEVFGYTREEMLGRTTAFLHVNEARLREFQAHLDTAVKERRYLHLLEFQMKRKDGTAFPTEHSVMPIQDEQGTRSGWVGVVRDITERVRANEDALQHREQLAHIMRVASMGELTASLAHELNQPLTAVVSNAQAAQRFLACDAPDLDEVRAALADIAESGLRAGSVIRGLRAMLRKGDFKQEPLDINEIVGEVVPLVQGEAVLNNVSIELKLAKGLPHVSGDRIQLEQVVLNLLLNGIEALRELEAGVRKLVVRTEQTTPDAVELAVLDWGVGLDEQTKDRIFDAFFSTKPGGLGMGLTINRSIVRAHNGQLWATQHPGGGAAFHVRLPSGKGKLT